MRLSAARARAYDMLQAEAAADERREITARGGIAPNHDGTPRVVVQSLGGRTYRARCSCGFEGTTVTAAEYRVARDEMVAHGRGCK